MVFCAMLHSLNKIKEEDTINPFNEQDTYFVLNDGTIYVLDSDVTSLTGPELENYITSYSTIISEMYIGANLTTIGTGNPYTNYDKIIITNPHTLTFRPRTTNITLKSYCFHGNRSCKSITFTDNMIIETNCFIYIGVSSLDFSPITNYTTMVHQTFGYNDYLTTINFGPYLTSISTHCFAFCANLTTITIPTNITSIGSWSFASNNFLTTVIYNGTSYTNYKQFESEFRSNGGSIGYDAFYGTPFIEGIINLDTYPLSKQSSSTTIVNSPQYNYYKYVTITNLTTPLENIFINDITMPQDIDFNVAIIHIEKEAMGALSGYYVNTSYQIELDIGNILVSDQNRMIDLSGQRKPRTTAPTVPGDQWHVYWSLGEDILFIVRLYNNTLRTDLIQSKTPNDIYNIDLKNHNNIPISSYGDGPYISTYNYNYNKSSLKDLKIRFRNGSNPHYPIYDTRKFNISLRNI